MKNAYTFPAQTVDFFDSSVLTERLHLMVALTLSLLRVEWVDLECAKTRRLQARYMRRVAHLTSRVQRAVTAIVKVKTHNALLRNKLDMLANPAWRARVIKDLGGMARLKLWDAQWRRALERLELNYKTGNGPARKSKPEKPEPVWWRWPERVAESERLKAHARLCRKAAVSPRSFKDPFKVDFEGQFRLAPIPRAANDRGLPRIYSKVDICEYGYDATPIWKDFGVGVSLVYPMEFYAAMMLESEDVSPIAILHEGNVRKCGTQPQEPEFEDRSRIWCNLQSKMHEVRDDKIESLDVASNDNHALIEFIGRKNYKYIFENPG